MALGGYLPPVITEIIAETGKFSAGMGKAMGEVDSFQAGVTKMAAAGKVAFLGLAAAAAAVGFESLKLAANFDQQMLMIHTQAGVPTKDMEMLRQGVLALAPAVGIGPEKLAEGLYHIASTGVPAAKQLDILTAAAKLAKIGMADLDTVTYALSGVMSVGMSDVHNATDAIAFMNATVGMGDMRMEQLAAAIGTGVLPAFKTAGLTMSDFSAALATIADNSTPADEAATRLRMTIALMSAPSQKALETMTALGMGTDDAAQTLRARELDFKKFGITTDQMAADMQKPHGLLVAVLDLKDHLKGLSTAEQNAALEHMFGGGKTSGTIETLIAESDKLAGKYDAQGTAEQRAAAIDQAWQDQQQQAKQKWDELVAKVQVYGVKIGDWLIPKISDAVDWTKKHKDAVKEFGEILAGPVAVAMAAYIATMGKAALANIAATWEFLLLFAAIGFAIYEIYKLNGAIKDMGLNWDQFLSLTGYAIDKWIYDHIGPAYNKLVDFANLVDRLTGGKGNTPHLPAPNMPDTGIGSSTGGQGRLINGAGMYPSFDQGGLVPGPIGAPLLAIVHGGETVTPSGGGGGDIVIHQRIVTPEGKVLRDQQLRYARRSGLTPAQLYPATARAI